MNFRGSLNHKVSSQYHVDPNRCSSYFHFWYNLIICPIFPSPNVPNNMDYHDSFWFYNVLRKQNCHLHHYTRSKWIETKKVNELKALLWIRNIMKKARRFVEHINFPCCIKIDFIRYFTFIWNLMHEKNICNLVNRSSFWTLFTYWHEYNYYL